MNILTNGSAKLEFTGPAYTLDLPGFKLGNVVVMAGVPSIMQAMMDIIAPKLRTGRRMLSACVRADAKEGDIGSPLRDIAAAHPDTSIGSYPYTDDAGVSNTNVVVRARDQSKLDAAMDDVKAMLVALHGARNPVR